MTEMRIFVLNTPFRRTAMYEWHDDYESNSDERYINDSNRTLHEVIDELDELYIPVSIEELY